jgi:DNA-binding protein HU-beta
VSLTQAQLVAELAEKNEPLTKVQVKALLETLTALAYKEAKNGFTLPGLGKLVLMKRAARMGRNPATGESIKIPAKTVLKFRVSKAAKEAINGPAKKKAPIAMKVVKKAGKKK